MIKIQMNIFDEAVNKLVAKGYTSVNAQKIITKVFQKAWIFAPWTQKLTEYGEKRNAMTPEQRAITRASKKDWHPVWRYKYNKNTWRALLKTQYR